VKVSRLVGISLVAGFLAAAINPVLAARENYYKGKVLTVVIGSKPGGGTDTTARLVARFWGNNIPGKPQVLVRNKGVQVTAANEMHNTTRPDGLTVNVYADAGSLGPLRRGSKSVKYNPLQWGIVGSIDRGPSILLIRKAAMDRLNDRSKPPVTIGSVSTDRAQDAMTLFGAEALGWNIKFVLGYPSSNQIYLAFERGEVDMFGSGTDDTSSRGSSRAASPFPWPRRSRVPITRTCRPTNRFSATRSRRARCGRPTAPGAAAMPWTSISQRRPRLLRMSSRSSVPRSWRRERIRSSGKRRRTPWVAGLSPSAARRHSSASRDRSISWPMYGTWSRSFERSTGCHRFQK
jgi:hypothetical protein